MDLQCMPHAIERAYIQIQRQARGQESANKEALTGEDQIYFSEVLDLLSLPTCLGRGFTVTDGEDDCPRATCM